jgi:hypothetical protein
LALRRSGAEKDNNFNMVRRNIRVLSASRLRRRILRSGDYTQPAPTAALTETR